ncbi:hypothetical protein ABID60_004496, partial [Bradyrhizobium sp. S3.5.5]
FKLRHKPISNQRSIIPRSTPSMEGGTETALTMDRYALYYRLFLGDDGSRLPYLLAQ